MLKSLWSLYQILQVISTLTPVTLTRPVRQLALHLIRYTLMGSYSMPKGLWNLCQTLFQTGSTPTLVTLTRPICQLAPHPIKSTLMSSYSTILLKVFSGILPVLELTTEVRWTLLRIGASTHIHQHLKGNSIISGGLIHLHNSSSVIVGENFHTSKMTACLGKNNQVCARQSSQTWTP
jgi:hypothetical protein